MSQRKSTHAHANGARTHAYEGGRAHTHPFPPGYLLDFYRVWANAEEAIKAMQNKKRDMLAEVRSQYGRHNAEAVKLTMRRAMLDDGAGAKTSNSLSCRCTIASPLSMKSKARRAQFEGQLAQSKLSDHFVEGRGKKMRKDKRQRHETLCAMIEETIAEHPQEFEGHTWAVRPQADWCEMRGVSDRTLRDLIKVPPICCSTTHVEGRKAVLLRLGTPGPKTDRHLANIMANVFAEKTGRRPSARDYGRLRGLAQVWPEDAQLSIFKLILNDWQTFKAGVQLEVDRMIADGEGGQHRYHEFPSISVLLRFHHVALEMFITHLQWENKKPPASIVALNPKLWRHLA